MKSIAWICVDFRSGSGGHRTIFQNINYLAKNGYKCDLYIDGTSETSEEIKERIQRDYFEINANIYSGKELKKKYDIVFATYFNTARYVNELDAKYKLYFVQDYEPWFFPMGENYLIARKSYKCDLNGISIGKWLANRISSEFGMKMEYFSFCADLNNYKVDKNIKKENAICFVYQPDKPRRCADMGLKALQIIKKERPDVKIYLYGSQKMVPFNIEAEHLGMLTVEECNKLYNKCKVGVCMSSSNPSRIPFEMMAAGLPVVDLYLENNVYDLPDEGCLLAEPSAESIAVAILKIIGNEDLQKRMSKGGAEYMLDYPLEKGFEEFKKAVESYCFEKKEKREKTIKKIYKRNPIVWKGDEIKVGSRVYFRSEEDIKMEKLELENRKKEEEWRRNLTITQRAFLKIRYILRGY